MMATASKPTSKETRAPYMIREAYRGHLVRTERMLQ